MTPIAGKPIIVDGNVATIDDYDPIAVLEPRLEIPLMDLNEDDVEITAADHFLHHFIHSNRPCLIRGKTNLYFAGAAAAWHSPSAARAWFRRRISVTTDQVPVRRGRHGRGMAASSLDPEGRAQECDTVLMSIDDWIAYLDGDALLAGDDETTKLYLKDWHLQSFLERQQQNHPQHHDSSSWSYTVPAVFPADLLNPFLNEFGIGDYRFVYWGPAGSTTAWHSDVMNSYSWSYNVYGTKEWKFEGWECPGLQRPGELMFVPAKLRHQVTNITEALSINHNWISVWNLADVWGCMKSEIKAVDRELESWKINEVDAKENMLRGCFGLDVASFIFMILFYGATCKTKDGELDHVRSQLRQILNDDQTFGISIRERLAATLMDWHMAEETMAMARIFTE